MMNRLDSIIHELRNLPEPKLEEVARYIDGLKLTTNKKTSPALLATAGCMLGADGEDFEQAVKAEADRIHGDAW